MAEPTRNLRKIRALLYKDNIAQYLTEFQDLNNVVRLDGQAMKEMVARAIPEKLIELVYSRHGTVPLNDLEFIAAIWDTGLTYESLILQLRHRRENPRERPGSRSEHSRSGQRQYHQQQNAGISAQHKNDNRKDTLWPSVKKALKGINQVNIDRHRKKKKSYWRCGRDRYQTLNCFATKAANGKVFPPAPGKESTAATGNKKIHEGTPHPAKPEKKK